MPFAKQNTQDLSYSRPIGVERKSRSIFSDKKGADSYLRHLEYGTPCVRSGGLDRLLRIHEWT
jgi:hypothetical protein